MKTSNDECFFCHKPIEGKKYKMESYKHELLGFFCQKCYDDLMELKAGKPDRRAVEYKSPCDPSYFLFKPNVRQDQVCHNAKTECCETCNEGECDLSGMKFKGKKK